MCAGVDCHHAPNISTGEAGSEEEIQPRLEVPLTVVVLVLVVSHCRFQPRVDHEYQPDHEEECHHESQSHPSSHSEEFICNRCEVASSSFDWAFAGAALGWSSPAS